uniref:RNA-directed DNA polymerase n=1 Tax=Meloidogyne enterolobii TaxID=390850 RepID=A0A6V7XIU2_MELEN|nr:unnamed protein product [Meloidogyne enterolobii]
MATFTPAQVQQLLNSFQELTNRLGVGSAGTPPNPNDVSASAATLAASLDSRIGKFNYDSEAGLTFDNWYKRYSNFFLEDGKSLPDAAKMRLLMGKLGDCEYALFSNAILPTLPDNMTFANGIAKLKELFGDSRSLFVRRYECFKMVQHQGQDISSFIAEVNAACETADLTLSKETLKCLIMVVGLRNEYHDLRQKCLQLLEEARRKNEALTLEKLGEECRAYLLIRESANSLAVANTGSSSTNAIHTKPQQWREKQRKGKPHLQGGRKILHNSPTKSKSKPNEERQCYSCGRSDHWRKDCRNRYSKCDNCGKIGHIAEICKSRKSSTNVRRIQTITASKYCLTLNAQGPEWYTISVDINGKEIEMKLDTASQISIFTENTWKKLGKPQLQEANLQVKNCNDISFETSGMFECLVSYKSKPKTLIGYVSKSIVHDLLGIPWIEELNIFPREISSEWISKERSIAEIKKETSIDAEREESLKKELKRKFPKVFDSKLGFCTKTKAHLFLKPEARPIFCKARPVPHGALQAVNEELDRLLEIGAIKPIEFSHWAAPILAVKKKSGKTRVCIDFSTGLNNALELNRHPLPRPDEIYSSLRGARFFSQLDLKDAYLQIELDNESKRLCGINTHRGLMQCQRLPFGVKSAPSIFQHLMDQVLTGINGAFCYLDDVIIASRSIKEHNEILRKVFTKIQDFGLKIQPEKCKFLQSEIKFLGHVITSKGISPDPKRSEAIHKMPAPHDISSLRSFLGALNYYGKFIKTMREIRAPLDELLRKDTEWVWTEKQQKAFEKAKEILLSDLLLTHYDPSLPIIVAADASKDGIGAVVSHTFPDGTEKAVEHSAITFSPAQRNYSQIEKEALALVFAVQKFHKMIYGRRFTLLTDHKPLLAIFGSKTGIPIYSANRLQRWAIILSNYDFEIKYIKTNDFGKADVLSRLIANYPKHDEDVLIANICSNTECFVNSTLGTQIQPLPVTAEDIAKYTSEDEVLQKLVLKIKEDWNNCKDIQLQPYFPKRQEIMEIEGCLVYGNRTIIPTKLRNAILKALHLAHPGVVKMKAIAKEHVYWPQINSDIERTIRQCQECQEAAKLPTKTTLTPWKTPEEVFHRVHIDFAGPCQNGHTYLLLVDAYSKWPEVYCMPNISAKNTVEALRNLVYRLGCPKEIVSDNGTQFRSSELAKFCKEYGIKQTFTPPFHPQSNGQVERFVDTFKRGMKKGKGDKLWCEKMLLAYRSTPHSALQGHSPDQLFLGRKLRTQLTLVHPAEQKKIPIEKRNREEYTKKMANQFNQKHGAKNSSFAPKDPVYLLNFRQNKTHWLPGTIIERVGNSPTYRVSVPSLGRDVHRHANQLRRRFMSDDTDHSVQIPPHQSQGSPKLKEMHQPEKEKISRRYPSRQRFQRKILDPDPSKTQYEFNPVGASS